MDATLPGQPARRIASLIERMGRIARARESASQLNPAQWEALRYLGRANRFSRRPSDVAAWLACGKGTASQTLMALERKGLVLRIPDGRDRRSNRLDLSRSGQDLVARDPLEDLSRSIARLPPLHAAALSQSLAHILDEITPASPTWFESCRSCRHFDETKSHCRRFAAALGDAESSRVCTFGEPKS